MGSGMENNRHNNSDTAFLLFFTLLAGGRMYQQIAAFRARAGLDMKRPRTVYLGMVAAVTIPVGIWAGQTSDGSTWIWNAVITFLVGLVMALILLFVWGIVMSIWGAVLRRRLTPQQLHRGVRWHYVTMEEAITRRDWNIQQFYNSVPDALMFGGAAAFGGVDLLGVPAVGSGMAAAQYRAEAQRWQGIANQIYLGRPQAVEDGPLITPVRVLPWLLLLLLSVSLLAPAVLGGF